MSTNPRRKLRSCSNGKQFWAKDGKEYWSLYDLARGLSEMHPETFKHHVSGSRNDFNKWVKEVVGDGTLAQGLRYLHDKESMAKRVTLRIRFLELMDDSKIGVKVPKVKRTLKRTVTKVAEKKVSKKKLVKNKVAKKKVSKRKVAKKKAPCKPPKKKRPAAKKARRKKR